MGLNFSIIAVEAGAAIAWAWRLSKSPVSNATMRTTPVTISLCMFLTYCIEDELILVG